MVLIEGGPEIKSVHVASVVDPLVSCSNIDQSRAWGRLSISLSDLLEDRGLGGLAKRLLRVSR